MADDPWTLYDDLVCRPWPSLTPPQRALVAIGSLETEVNNGGFDQYFFNSAGDLASEAVSAAESLDLRPLADLIVRAMALLPGGYIRDRNARQAALVSVDSEVFEALDEEFYALERTLDLNGAMRKLAEDA